MSTTTDSGAASPPPTDVPSPLAVGTRFVKQYYQVLSTTPDQIFRFYQPTSTLSHGVGSLATEPATFEKTTVADRFDASHGPIRFDFERGAIDAQVSVNSGVLLVVTGHVVYLEEMQRRKAFAHTFFLGSMVQGQKRSSYVHNDILRFLHDDDQEKTVDASNNNSVKKTEAPTKEPATAVVPDPDEKEEPEAPGGGVEETKEIMEEDEEVSVGKEEEEKAEVVEKAKQQPKDEEEIVAASTESKKSKSDEKAKKVDPEKQDDDAAGAKPVPAPGSWASLFAGNATQAPRAPAETQAPRASKQKNKPKPTAAPTIATATAPPPADAGEDRRQQNKRDQRDPDATLVVKNITNNTKQQEVLDLIEPYAGGAKVVGITVSTHKAIAFIDYETPVPVLAVVEQHQNKPFQLHGRGLDVYQKTLERKKTPPGGKGGNNRNDSRGGGRGRRGRGGGERERERG
jgi:hypothetical protein